MGPRAFADILRRPLSKLPHELEMTPLPGPFHARITPPGSKSITNRALLMAALAEGESRLTNALLDADDARVMIEALSALGADLEIEDREHGRVRVGGTGGRFSGNRTLNLNNAGTATRFLTAAACLADAPVVIDGNARMRQRPIGELVSMLRSIGVRIEELGAPGCVPLRIHPIGAAAGRPGAPGLEVGRTASSQFVSAMLIVGPLLPGGLRLRFTTEPTSVSYINMTLTMMRQRLALSPHTDPPSRSVEVPPSVYRAIESEIEPDASGATYFWGAGAIVPGSSCSVPIDPHTSSQHDAQFAGLLGVMGARVEQGAVTTVSAAPLAATEAELTLVPDTAMTAAAVACFATGRTTLTGLRTLRVKETDRIRALCIELQRIGVDMEDFRYVGPEGKADEGLWITPPEGGIDSSPSAPRVVFDTYDDHRMAMSLALIGLRRPNVVIRDPACVAKTYPTFWRDLASLYDASAGSGDTHDRS